MSDLKSTIKNLQYKAEELLKQDSTNRDLLKDLLAKHEQEKKELEAKIMKQSQLNSIHTTPSDSDTEDETIKDLQQQLKNLKEKHKSDIEKLKKIIADQEKEKKDADEELCTLLNKLEELSCSQIEVKDLLTDALKKEMQKLH